MDDLESPPVVPQSLDQVCLMREQLNSLRCEKSLLKSKIIRKRNQKFVREITLAQDPKIKRSLLTELKCTEDYNTAKESEVDALNDSDLIATIDELEQETIVLHQEVLRVHDKRDLADRAFAEICRDFEAASRRYSKEVLRKNRILIHSLRQEIAAHQSHIQKTDQDRKSRLSLADTKKILAKSIATLKSQISDTESEIAALDSQIAEISELNEVESGDLDLEPDL